MENLTRRDLLLRNVLVTFSFACSFISLEGRFGHGDYRLDRARRHWTDAVRAQWPPGRGGGILSGGVRRHLPRHWINPKTGDVTGLDITIGRATFTVCGANPKREADASLPGPCPVPAPGRASTIFQLCVDDIDATVALAVAAGATIRTPAQDADWGDRVATILDPFGHIWALATINHDLSVAEYNARNNIQLVEAA